MRFEKITLASALEQAGDREIYILTELSDQTTLADFKKAKAYVVQVEEDEQIQEPEATAEEPARKPKIDHDEVIKLAQEGYPPKEIAQLLGCSEQSVRNHIARDK